MATYYASPTGGGTECSLANPGTLAYAYTTKASNGDTIKIGYGSYDIALYLSKTLTFEGTSELGSGTEVLWENTATDQNTIINNSGGLNTFKNIHFKNAYSASRSIVSDSAAGSNTVFENCILEVQNTKGNKFFESRYTMMFDKCDFRGSGAVATSYPYDVVTGTTTIQRSFVRPLPDGTLPGYLRVRNGGTLNVYNSNVMGMTQVGITVDSGGTLNINNSPMFAIGAHGSAAASYNISNSGTCNASNNYTALAAFVGTNNNLNNCTNANGIGPDVGIKMRGGYPSYFNFSMDVGVHLESGAGSYTGSMMTNVFGPRGKTYTILVSPGYSIGQYGEATAKTKLQALHAMGIEIGSHGHSHTDVDIVNIFKWQYDGAESSPTVNVDIANLKIYFATTEGTDNAEFSIVDAVDGSEVSDLKAFLVGKNWSIQNEDEDGNSGYLRITSLADTGGAQALVGTPPQLQATLDKTGLTSGFYKNEMADTKAWLESAIQVTNPSYSCDVWTYSSAMSTEEAEGMVKAAGYIIGDAGYTGGQGSHFLGDFNLWNHYRSGYENFGDPTTTETVIKRKARAWFSRSYVQPCFFSLLSHTALEFTEEQIGWILEVLEQEFPWITVTRLDTLSSLITGSGLWATSDDGVTYQRTYDILDVSNFRLCPSSPAVNTGTDVGLTTDYDGLPICGLPDIGAYEYQLYSGSLRRIRYARRYR